MGGVEETLGLVSDRYGLFFYGSEISNRGTVRGAFVKLDLLGTSFGVGTKRTMSTTLLVFNKNTFDNIGIDRDCGS